jgi:nitroreductase
MRQSLVLIALGLLPCASSFAQEVKPIDLLKPQTEGGKPLMEALKQRQSQREFSPEKLAPQVLSNLLWAAFGINRPESGKRTAPSAHNRQDMEVYVATAEGLFLYEAKGHRLMPVLSEDVRARTGTQEFVRDVAVNLVYVAPIPAGADESALIFAGAHAGLIAENVYLFCASEGLATVVRGSIDRDALSKAMKLPAGRRIILAQSVGYPRKP